MKVKKIDVKAIYSCNEWINLNVIVTWQAEGVFKQHNGRTLHW